MDASILNQCRQSGLCTSHPPFALGGSILAENGMVPNMADKANNKKVGNTVDGRNPAPVEVGSLAHYLRSGSFTSKRWLGMGFLKHQQYGICQIPNSKVKGVSAFPSWHIDMSAAILYSQQRTGVFCTSFEF